MLCCPLNCQITSLEQKNERDNEDVDQKLNWERQRSPEYLKVAMYADDELVWTGGRCTKGSGDHASAING
ncbi:hypothetical protein N7493_008262 [Penicillium malachiteum]|uniref:Uncharacterized protein n=1 Tax=Penicillium malachiteum TaxID=1324776 RepID=A0AAD6MTM4_9EURO|nr:hypothetical protein N7493_008262 [Penicillium malachiteum]